MYLVFPLTHLGDLSILAYETITVFFNHYVIISYYSFYLISSHFEGHLIDFTFC